VTLRARTVRAENAETSRSRTGRDRIHSASFMVDARYTIVAHCLRVGIWPTDNAADPYYEVINAIIITAMATIPGAICCALLARMRQMRALGRASQAFSAGTEIFRWLVWHACTRRMTTTVPQRWID